MHNLFLIAAAATIVCCGCGDGDGRVPVEGVITLDGKPLSSVSVTFDQPDLGPSKNVGYVGRTDDQGRYSLRPMIGEGSGVPPGEYQVMLTTAVTRGSQTAPPPAASSSSPFGSDTPPPPPERIPPAFRNGKQKFTVPAGGTQDADFALTSK